MMTIRLYDLLCFIGSMNDDYKIIIYTIINLLCFIGSMNDDYKIIRFVVFYRKYE